MVKKMVLISLAVVLMLSMANIASAKESVTNTSQKGSLLVFPKVMAFTDPSPELVDTYIFIGNDNTVGTWVKCYWMDNNQTAQDFFFYLTPNQPVVFSAISGGTDDFPVPPFLGIGTLACWASQDDDSAPKTFNHLYDNVMILRGGGANTMFYNAYSFAALGGNLSTALADSGIQLRLTGDLPAVADRGYDACPQYLVFNFFPEGNALALGRRPDLTLWPCRQDLRQDRVPTCTKAKFDVWNENEVKFTGAYQCFKCFFEGFLTDIGVKDYLKNRGPGYGGTKFTDGVLRTDGARARVQGIYSSLCVASNVANQPNTPAKTKAGGISCPNIPAGATDWASRGAAFSAAWGTSAATITPLLGVVMYGLPADDPFHIFPVGAYTPFGAGAAKWATAADPGVMGGWLKADPGAGALEAAGR